VGIESRGFGIAKCDDVGATVASNPSSNDHYQSVNELNAILRALSDKTILSPKSAGERDFDMNNCDFMKPLPADRSTPFDGEVHTNTQST